MGTISTSMALAIGAWLLRHPPSPPVADVMLLCLAMCATLSVFSFLRTAD